MGLSLKNTGIFTTQKEQDNLSVIRTLGDPQFALDRKVIMKYNLKCH